MRSGRKPTKMARPGNEGGMRELARLAQQISDRRFSAHLHEFPMDGTT